VVGDLFRGRVDYTEALTGRAMIPMAMAWQKKSCQKNGTMAFFTTFLTADDLSEKQRFGD
jgi:hypothetical protein